MNNWIEIVMKNQFKQLRVSLTMAARSEWKAGLEFQSLSQHHCLVLPISGSFSYQLDGKRIHSEPGRLYYFPTGSTQNCTVDQEAPFLCYWVGFTMDAGSSEFFQSLQLPFSAEMDFPDVTEIQLRRLIHSCGSLAGELKARAIIMELLADFLENSLAERPLSGTASSLDQIFEVLNYIEEHLADNLTVEQMAQQIFLHPNYFITLFRNITGSTPIQYVNQRKMDHARKLLESSRIPVQDVARAVGLPNHYFSRMFKQLVGTSPRRYRQLMEENRLSGEAEQRYAQAGMNPADWNEEYAWMEEAIGCRHNNLFVLNKQRTQQCCR